MKMCLAIFLLFLASVELRAQATLDSEPTYFPAREDPVSNPQAPEVEPALVDGISEDEFRSEFPEENPSPFDQIPLTVVHLFRPNPDRFFPRDSFRSRFLDRFMNTFGRRLLDSYSPFPPAEDEKATSYNFPFIFDENPQNEGQNPWDRFPFSSIFTEQDENDTTSHPIFNPVSPPFHSLPDNYSDSTHDVHYIDGQKVTVNQTVKKNFGPNFKNFFHFKVIQSHPNTPVESDAEAEVEFGRGDQPIEETIYSEFPAANQDENEIRTPKRLVQHAPYRFNPARYERAISDRNTPRDNSIEEDSELLNSNEIDKKDGSLSIEDHFDGVPPPDLSSDTRVNSIASDNQQQGFSIVDPDAEVFDLGLVFKEMESHADLI